MVVEMSSSVAGRVSTWVTRPTIPPKRPRWFHNGTTSTGKPKGRRRASAGEK